MIAEERFPYQSQQSLNPFSAHLKKQFFYRCSSILSAMLPNAAKLATKAFSYNLARF